MEFLMYVPMSELELDIIEANDEEIEIWYYSLKELTDEHGEDHEYQVLVFEAYEEISTN